MHLAYGMLPDTGTGSNEATSGVPVDVGNTVVVGRVHELQVGGQILLALWLLALKVQVKELHIETLLRMNCGHDNEATFRRPVDSIAVLLIVCSDVLEIADTSSLNLFGAVEGDGRLGRDS